MSVNESKESSDVRCNCGRIRGKKCQPWRNCRSCSSILCLFCAPKRIDNPQCHTCWNKEYEANQKIVAQTPVECVKCKRDTLPVDMGGWIQFVGKVCKRCEEEYKAEQAKLDEVKKLKENLLNEELQKSWTSGTVRKVVVDGYTYLSDLPLTIGTKVWLPPTWVDKANGRDNPHEGTVTSFVSDYTGKCNWIIGIKANEKPPAIDADSPTRKLLIEAKAMLEKMIDEKPLPIDWRSQIMAKLCES